jgi:hypothetical protein
MADTTSAPKGALVAGLVFILLSFAGCGYGCVSGTGLVSSISDAIESANSTPLNEPTTLAATGSNGIILTSDTSAICEVLDADGNSVTVSDPPSGASGTFESGGTTLELAYGFDTQEGDTYDVICGDPDAPLTGSYAVASVPSLSGFGGLLAGVGFGGLFFLIGLVLLIVGLVQRSKWKKRSVAAPGGFGAPPMAGAPPAPGAPMTPGAPPAPGAPPMPSAMPPPMAPQPPPAAPQPSIPPLGPDPAAPPAPPASPPPPPSGGTPPPPPPPPPAPGSV